MAKEVIRGDPFDLGKIFQWETAKVNTPSTDGFDPSQAWLTRIWADGTLAVDVFTYVDDQQCTANAKQKCWLAERCIGSINTYLDIQDASQKRREPS